MPEINRSFTLTNANQNYSIIALLKAAGLNPFTAWTQLYLVGYKGVDGIGANTKDVEIGDLNMVGGDGVFAVSPGQGFNVPTSGGTCDITQIAVRSASALQKIGISGRWR